MRGELFAVLLWAALFQGCGRNEEGPASAPLPPPPPLASPAPLPPPVNLRVTWIDAQDRPLSEARLANLPASAFDGQGRLREEAVASSPDRLRVLVEDPASGVSPSVSVSSRPSDPPLVLPLAGPAGRRVSPPFLLLGDREDAAAGAGRAIWASPGDYAQVRYRDGAALSLRIGPSAIHEIPVRFVAVGAGAAPTAEIERAVEQRLAQANAVWAPFGRRFKRGPVVRLESFRGLFLIRGRAAGADGQGRPSRCGILLDGREASVPANWKNDGAPMTPKATARALLEKIGRSFQVDVLDGLLAGDREAVVLRVRRRDGTLATVERLADGNDVAQAVTPLPADAAGGIEASPSPATLSLDEIALLASGRGAASDGIDVFIVPGLRSLQARPAFKVYPAGVFPEALAGSAVLSWSILDGSGRFPYAMARAMGELLLPPGLRPASEDSLFAEPLSESPAVVAHKRVTAATGQKIAERGRGLAAKNVDKN